MLIHVPAVPSALYLGTYGPTEPGVWFMVVVGFPHACAFVKFSCQLQLFSRLYDEARHGGTREANEFLVLGGSESTREKMPSRNRMRR